jgi:hypothetical protein
MGEATLPPFIYDLENIFLHKSLSSLLSIIDTAILILYDPEIVDRQSALWVSMVGVVQ